MFKWSSPSSCYILAIAPTDNNDAETKIEIELITNCDNEYNLQYEVISRGNIVLSGSELITNSKG